MPPGPDFAKLLLDGWVPAGIVPGLSAAGLPGTLVTTTRVSCPGGTGNAEVPSCTSLMVHVRQDARGQLEQTAREPGADGVVVSAMTVRVQS